MDLKEKVLKAKKGDDNAFYELIQNKKDMLYRTAYTYARNKEDALDIVGETVYKAYKTIKKLKKPQFFNTWITRILITTSLDYIKKHKKTLPLKEGILIPDSPKEVDAAVKLDLYHAVDKLIPKYKTIIILKYFHDLTLTQISQVLQLPIGTVKTHLHKALEQLRYDIKEDLVNE